MSDLAYIEASKEAAVRPETGVEDLSLVKITYTPALMYSNPWLAEDSEWPVSQFITYDEATKLYAALGDYLNS